MTVRQNAGGIAPAEHSSEAIHGQLDRILNSALFAQSERLSRFLRYTVEETLQGRADRIKEYVLALDVFDRPESFDPQTDPIVRVHAGRLRAKLQEYYETAGREDPILIEFPKRSYVPTFSKRAPRPSLWPKVAMASAALVLVGLLAWWGVGEFRRVARPTEIRSIAVLPFTDLSPAKDQQYFCDGVTEEITDVLMRAEGLRVIGPQSAFQLRDSVHDFKSIKRELNVAAAVHGSVRRAADRIRITAQLIDLTDGSLLWSETYERDSSDILAVQIGIAREIVDRLELSLPGRRNAKQAKLRDMNPKAHDLYLWGRYFWNLRTKEGIEKGIEYLEKAVAEDPAYGQAWSGLADAYTISAAYNLLPPGEALRKAKAAAVKALEIDDTLAEAHASLAYSRFWLCDWSGIEQELRRSIDLNPNYAFARQWYAEYLVHTGRVSEALAEAKRALELNPLSVSTWTSSGFVLIFARRYDEAIGRFRRALDLDRNSFYAHMGLGRAYMEKKMYPDAIRELRPLSDVPPALGTLGSTYARAGRREEARRVIGRLLELSPDWPISAFVAMIYADLGEPKLALEYLQKGTNMPTIACVWVATSTTFDTLQGDPRYHALLSKMGLEQ